MTGSPLILQPAAAAGIDTTVISTSPLNNRGIATSILAGATTKALLMFDLSAAIPKVASCVSAVLSVYQAATGAANAFTITAYSIAIGNTAWIEGTKTNSQAGAGEPCWNALAADGAGGVTTPWAGSAGLATSGTDYEASALGSVSGNRSDADGTEYQISLTPTRIKNWFGSPNTNYGLLLVANATLGNIASSDHATATWRPKLVVTYTLPGGGILNPPFSAPMRGPFG